MLDKLNRNKFLVLILVLVIFSCEEWKKERILMLPDTELSCPDGLKVLIKYAKLEDVRYGILYHIAEKKRTGTTENYTAIRFPDGRSFKIDKKPPEEMIKCTLRESNYRPIKSRYVY